MEETLEKKQNRKMTVFAGVLSILSIGLLVFGFFLVSSDKVVMLQSISNLTATFNNYTGDYLILDKLADNNDVGLRTKIDFSSDYLNEKGNITFDYLENKEEKKSDLSFKMNLSNEKLMNTHVALEQDKIYFFIDELIPHYYHTDFNYFTIFSKLNSSDYDKIMVLIKETLNNSIREKDIQKQKKIITYKGREKKVNQLTYPITNDAIYDFVDNMFISIKKDKKLLHHLSSSFNITDSQLIDNMNQKLDELKNREVESTLYYRIYYYGFNRIVGYEIGDTETNIKVQYQKDKNDIISISSDNRIVFYMEVNTSDNSFDGYVVRNDKVSFSGVCHNQNQLDFVIQDDINVSVVMQKQSENDEYYYNAEINAKKGTKQLARINISAEYYFGEKIKSNAPDSVDISHMILEDGEQLMKNLENYSLYPILENFIKNFNL